MLIFTLFLKTAEWGTLARLKVYEICVRKNIIVSYFLSLIAVILFGVKMECLFAVGETMTSCIFVEEVITMFGDVISGKKTTNPSANIWMIVHEILHVLSTCITT
jgi:hypothetical protein